MNPGLYLISTPIGNLKDITLRALESLFNLDILLCEDTRHTQRMLSHYLAKYSLIASTISAEVNFEQMPRLVSFHEHNEKNRLEQVIAWLKQDKAVGLVSNAGTPLISDPGYHLVVRCYSENLQVRAIAGISAVTAALTVSGFSADKFLFLGFLPRKRGKQMALWRDIAKSETNKTVIFYESKFRVKKTLDVLCESLGDVCLVIARELTKLHEEILRGTVKEIIKVIDKKEFKGELVCLFRYQVNVTEKQTGESSD